MKEFWILFKYELKMQLPIFRKKGKFDIIGTLMTLLILAFMIFISLIFLSKIMENYLFVEQNKVYAPIERAGEILNVIYLVILTILTMLFLEHTRKVFADDKNKVAFLRLPISQRNIFLSKFCVLLFSAYATCFIFVITINAILSAVLSVGVEFWLATIGVCAFMPLVSLLLVALLIVPYIKIIEALINKYLLLFISFSVLLAVAFILYSGILSIVQTLLTTGSIRFLFNEKFVMVLKEIFNYSYPTNAFVNVLFGNNALVSWLIILLFAVVSFFAMVLVSKKLYNVTLYKMQNEKVTMVKPNKDKKLSPISSLVKKEFICVYRQPKYIFAYFSIAMTMPIMVYSCFTLFETLIFNAIGLRINFALALFVILLFGVLTNSFCSTNISRDGLGLLKMKTLPISASKLFFAKVIFCAIISSLAVIASCLLLIILTTLSFLDGLICMIIGVVFTIAQILVATRLDLNQAKMSSNEMEVHNQSNKTLARVVLIGGVLTVISSVASVFFALFATSINIFGNTGLVEACVYLIPSIIGAMYLILAVIYYRTGIIRSFERLAG